MPIAALIGILLTVTAQPSGTVPETTPPAAAPGPSGDPTPPAPPQALATAGAAPAAAAQGATTDPTPDPTTTPPPVPVARSRVPDAGQLPSRGSLLDQLAKPGGRTIALASGVYTGGWSRERHDRPLVLAADGPVVVDGSLIFAEATNVELRGDIVVRGMVRLASARGITLHGLEITNPGASKDGGNYMGVKINALTAGSPPSTDIVLRDLYIHDTYDDSINISGARRVEISDVITERTDDLAGDSCAGNRCHTDALQVMGPTHDLRLRRIDAQGNWLFKSDFGDIDATVEDVLVHDGGNYGIQLFEVDATTVRVTVRPAVWAWNHAYGCVAVREGADMIGREHVLCEAP